VLRLFYRKNNMPLTGEAKKAYQREWIRKRRETFFQGKVCVKCGSDENLELDHIDPDTKELQPAALWSMSDQNPKKIAEIAKCQILCEQCHLIKSGTEALHGSRHGMAKLTEDTVMQLRQLYSTGNYSYSELAIMFNVSKATIGTAMIGQTWSHV